MPWRTTRSPYWIWLSEIMSQQTQISTVIPYFLRFIDTFPNIQSLAKASQDQVFELWAGLGYYRRARLLHECAQLLCENLQGRFPSTRKELLSLPGIGRYTSAAIASIAFNEFVGVVDGNVKRVLSRVLAKDLGQNEHEAWVQAWMDRSIQASDSPGDFNEAFMELGARVCTPKSPSCSICPLQKICSAHHRGQTNEFPTPRRRAKVRELRLVALVLENNGDLLISREAPSSLFAGVAHVPLVEQHTYSRLSKELKWLSPVHKNEKAMEHELSHRRLHVEVHCQKILETEIRELCTHLDDSTLELTSYERFQRKPKTTLFKKVWHLASTSSKSKTP